MDEHTTDVQPQSTVSGPHDDFDIQVGMTVHDSAGQLLGRVVDVEGFGATHLQDTSHGGVPRDVTQTRGGTGFIKIDRLEVLGQVEVPALTVPFHSVQSVTPDHGVVLHDTALAEIRAQAEGTTEPLTDDEHSTRGGWHRYVTGHGNDTHEDSRVAEQETEELREEAVHREQKRHGETVSDAVTWRGMSRTHDPEFTLGGGTAEQSGFDEEMKS